MTDQVLPEEDDSVTDEPGEIEVTPQESAELKEVLGDIWAKLDRINLDQMSRFITPDLVRFLAPPHEEGQGCSDEQLLSVPYVADARGVRCLRCLLKRAQAREASWPAELRLELTVRHSRPLTLKGGLL